MHFTYAAATSADLCQGDVLKRTPDIEKILKDVHPHYTNAGYKFFMVLSQTCDLVRRNGGDCNTRLVTIATIRPLDDALKRQLKTYQGALEAEIDVCSERFKDKLLMYVRSLFNNNNHEFFFLRQEGGFGIPIDMCVFLREAIPLRSSEHYEALMEARICSLEPTFQAKLGWLVGHIFSRVATDDWVPRQLDKATFDELTAFIVDELTTWVEDSRLRQAKKAISTTPGLTTVQKRALVDKANSISKKTEILNGISAVIAREFPQQFPNMPKLQEKLASDPTLKRIFGA